MGDPRKIRKKYSKPIHPWERLRIEDERIIKKDYGLKNKKEIWKFTSRVRKLNSQIKKIIKNRTAQSAVEEKQLLDKLYKIGIMEKDAKLEDALGLDVKRILDRRLQTMVYKKNLANSMEQARQFIIHGHISVGDQKVTVPSYIVLRGEEEKITYRETSSLKDPEHPERKAMEKDIKKEKIKKESNVEKDVVEEGIPVTDEEFKEKEAEAQKTFRKMQDTLLEQKEQNDENRE